MSNLASLPNGEYAIFSKASEFVVGRNVAEDFSNLPKGIFTLNRSVGTDGGRRWTISGLGNGKFKLQAGGALVGANDGLLWAFIDKDIIEPANCEWILEEAFQEGENSYIIWKPDHSAGWAADMGEAPDGKQIAVTPLISQPSEPPRYPPFQVFVIKPVGY